jgi:hypothetical protein
MSYTFPGIRPFLDRAVENSGLTDPQYVGLAQGGAHVRKVVDALSQLGEQRRLERIGHIPAGSCRAAVEHVDQAIKSLAAQLEALTAARDEAVEGLAVEGVEPLRPKPKARKPSRGKKDEPDPNEPPAPAVDSPEQLPGMPASYEGHGGTPEGEPAPDASLQLPAPDHEDADDFGPHPDEETPHE